jgi:hypothetical protein
VDKARNRAKVETRARAECPDRAVKAARKVENKAKAARAVPKVDDKVPAGRAARVVQVLAAEARAAPAAVRAAAPVQAEAVETAANCSYYPEQNKTPPCVEFFYCLKNFLLGVRRCDRHFAIDLRCLMGLFVAFSAREGDRDQFNTSTRSSDRGT